MLNKSYNASYLKKPLTSQEKYCPITQSRFKFKIFSPLPADLFQNLQPLLPHFGGRKLHVMSVMPFPFTFAKTIITLFL